MSKELLARKAELEKELDIVEAQLLQIERNLKPYEAVASGYSGTFSTFFKTEEQARKKFEEYYGKTYFRNGLLYGVTLKRHNEDGTIDIIDWRAKEHRSNWKPAGLENE